VVAHKFSNGALLQHHLEIRYFQQSAGTRRQIFPDAGQECGQVGDMLQKIQTEESLERGFCQPLLPSGKKSPFDIQPGAAAVCDIAGVEFPAKGIAAAFAHYRQVLARATATFENLFPLQVMPTQERPELPAAEAGHLGRDRCRPEYFPEVWHRRAIELQQAAIRTLQQGKVHSLVLLRSHR